MTINQNTMVLKTHQDEEAIADMGLDTTPPPRKRLCLRERKKVKYNQVNSMFSV